jgi:hypothetical protein
MSQPKKESLVWEGLENMYDLSALTHPPFVLSFSLYLDQVVIPAEELFVPTQVPREAYMAYSATVPRWFSLGIAQKIQELKEMKCPM